MTKWQELVARSEVSPNKREHIVVDRVELRKSWSKQATYFVSIIKDPTSGYSQVWKSWEWVDTQNEVISGKINYGRPSKEDSLVWKQYLEAIKIQLDEKDYIIQNRQTTLQSPAPASEKAPDFLVKCDAGKVKKKPELRRSGSFDWV